MEGAACQQRCMLGLHMRLTDYQAKPFHSFYSGPECCGFKPLAETAMAPLVKQSLTRQFDLLVSMQDAFKREGSDGSVSRDALMLQRDRVLGLQYYYEFVSGEEFKNELPCTRYAALHTSIYLYLVQDCY
jgi:hypothetical protein